MVYCTAWCQPLIPRYRPSKESNPRHDLLNIISLPAGSDSLYVQAYSLISTGVLARLYQFSLNGKGWCMRSLERFCHQSLLSYFVRNILFFPKKVVRQYFSPHCKLSKISYVCSQSFISTKWRKFSMHRIYHVIMMKWYIQSIFW